MKNLRNFTEVLDAPYHGKLIPMLMYALCIGILYGVAFGVCAHHISHENALFAGLFVGGIVFVFRVIIWAIGLGIKQLNKPKEEK